MVLKNINFPSFYDHLNFDVFQKMSKSAKMAYFGVFCTFFKKINFAYKGARKLKIYMGGPYMTKTTDIKWFQKISIFQVFMAFSIFDDFRPKNFLQNFLVFLVYI